jgi:hypothetical protein
VVVRDAPTDVLHLNGSILASTRIINLYIYHINHQRESCGGMHRKKGSRIYRHVKGKFNTGLRLQITTLIQPLIVPRQAVSDGTPETLRRHEG